MPHCRPEDLPDPTSRGWPSAEGGFRAAHWGDMEVCYTTVDGPLDCTEQYKWGRCPGGVCPCAHYFYVFEGRIRCIWPESDIPDEVVSAGEVCFFPSGHVLVYEEASKVLELNPRRHCATAWTPWSAPRSGWPPRAERSRRQFVGAVFGGPACVCFVPTGSTAQSGVTPQPSP